MSFWEGERFDGDVIRTDQVQVVNVTLLPGQPRNAWERHRVGGTE
jgi:hypothetical protein